MKRILCSLLVATLPFGSVLADAPKEKNSQGHPRSPARAAERSRQEHQGRARRIQPGRLLAWPHASQIRLHHATVLEGAIRSQVNDGPLTIYKAGQSFSELPGDRHGVAGQAPRGVHRGHERDGPDDPIREPRFDTFRPEI